ncbi:MAG: hypothetical protein IPH58_16330 [Sphingobacteriales bacterium]|nr:hypothetical protein [Sphingobacteriales bacterium]
MKIDKNIRLLSGWILMLAFLIVATPKSMLHDLFSKHTDHSFQTTDTIGGESFSVYHYNCGFINDYTINPYLSNLALVESNNIYFQKQILPALSYPFINYFLFSDKLRGPPFFT